MGQFCLGTKCLGHFLYFGLFLPRHKCLGHKCPDTNIELLSILKLAVANLIILRLLVLIFFVTLPSSCILKLKDSVTRKIIEVLIFLSECTQRSSDCRESITKLNRLKQAGTLK